MSPAPVRHPSDARLYAYVLAPAVVVVCLVGIMAIGSVMVLGAVRAYVGGESLWSKARHEAVTRLETFAATRDPLDFARYEQALQVPLGDRRARENMLPQHMDMEAVRQGFRDGGIHPDDIDGMVSLYRYFGELPLFKGALDAWADGDSLIAALQVQAERLREADAAHAPPARVRAILREVASINTALQLAELRFGSDLARASRVTERLLVMAMLTTAAALSLAAYVVMRRGLRTVHHYQQALTTANRRWELAVVGAELGLFEIDAAAGTVSLDAHAASLYGLPREAVTLTGASLMARIAPEDRERADTALKEAVARREVFRLTVRLPLPGGDSRYLETIGSLPDDAGKGAGVPARLIGVARDVTQERVRAQVTVARDAAEKVAAAQRHFLSRLSHELRTPLNAILGFAQLLSIDREHPLPPSQQRQLNWILQAGQQLLQLVEEVLDISKVEAGETRIEPSRVELASVARTSVALVTPAMKRYDVTVINRIPEDGLELLADELRLQQVLVNLLSNGCKYNRPGGHVTLDARTFPDRICIDVADDGIGVSAEDMAGLFEPFMRVSAVSAKVDGTGLGLYTVKQLVSRMGGSVSARSQPGQGSCFTVCLPRALSAAQRVQAALSD